MKLLCRKPKIPQLGAEQDGTRWARNVTNTSISNLEKRRYEKRHITKLKTPEGITVNDPTSILSAIKTFTSSFVPLKNSK